MERRDKRGMLLFVALLLFVGVGLMLIRTRQAAQRVAEWNRQEEPSDTLRLFYFDPNTISYDSLKQLGFSKSQARQLIHYREAGKIYRMAEDLDGVYGMTDSLFQRIRPWVRIGEPYRLKPHSDTATYPSFPLAPHRTFHAPNTPF
ncbi:MAG: helix-hairpin-helix domain-containing protein, partial [Alistipes sp.]|nr:helix-hairpin-helix domain-containing protein [Alistipes sp.]